MDKVATLKYFPKRFLELPKVKGLKVIFLSEWLSNPYKDLLSDSLRVEGAEVEEYFWKTFYIPLVFQSWMPTILHLHALHPFLRGKSALRRFLKFGLFVGQLAFLRLIGIKTVWTVHEWADKLDTSSSKINQSYTKIIGVILHGFIVHNPSTKDAIVNAFRLKNPKKVSVIPHGNYIGFYDNQITRNQANESLGIAKNHFVFLVFGGLYRYKGVLEAIQAFKQLEYSQATLVIAGEPSEKGLKEEIELELQSSSKPIVFTPAHILDSEIQIYMNSCNCVIVPYKVFTTSGVAILAMSFGRICIAPKIGFFNDVFSKEGAFLYAESCPTGLKNALSEAVAKRASIVDMEQHNLRLAKEWSWGFVAKQTLDVYR